MKAPIKHAFRARWPDNVPDGKVGTGAFQQRNDTGHRLRTPPRFA